MKVLFLFVFSFCSVILFAQQIRYTVAAPNAAHHEAEISLRVYDLPKGPALFRMSRSSPGRYATHEFGKNVYNVKAVDQNGRALPLEKVESDVYRLARHSGNVVLSYTLYGNYADGTYAEIDPTHFHLNMPAAFIWVKGLEKAPITLELVLPEPSWTVATQLKPTPNPAVFTAPDLQYFMDSPVKAGNLLVRQWTVANPDKKTYTFRLMLEADAGAAALDTFTGRVKNIVAEAKAVFRELPRYDYGTYTFIAGINPYVKGDGMEHRNSTMITLGVPFSNNPRLLSVFSHEFFHCWNVERIRPKSLEPFNFEKSNMSEALWLAEGFTQYYGLLLLRRAGINSDEAFYQQMAGLIAQKEQTPGGQLYAPIENSQRGVFVDAGVSIDRTNYPNMFTSYYSYGAALALALDMQLRQQFGRSLDVFMQELWKRFGKTEKPYTMADVEQALASVSSPAFAAAFFRQHIYGHQAIDYAPLLQPAGLQLKSTAPGAAWMGNLRILTEEAGNLVVGSNTIRNTPLYNAGVDVGDVLLQMGGREVRTLAGVEAILAQHKPGDALPVTYSHRGRVLQATLKLQENPAFILMPHEQATNAQQAFRQSWYGPKANN